jgi:hypothetical protein
MSSLDDLVADPLFQLNSLLWLAQPLPSGSNVTPLLWKRGFAVHALAPLLTLPPDVRLKLQDAGVPHQGSARPDVVLRREIDRRHGVVENKGKSFGPKSSTAEQARTLLVASGPRAAEILGLRPADIVRSATVYLVAGASAQQMRETLRTLGTELKSAGIESGETSVFGIEFDSDAVYLAADNDARDFFELQERLAFLVVEAGNDPRPLYFIPYDPDCQQHPEEEAFGKRVLFERIQAAVLGAAGRALPPATVLFERELLLNEATWRVYELWANQDAKRHLKKLVRFLLDKLASAVCAEVQEAFLYIEKQGWLLNIASSESQARICSVLSRFSCETMEVRVDQGELFD